MGGTFGNLNGFMTRLIEEENDNTMEGRCLSQRNQTYNSWFNCGKTKFIHVIIHKIVSALY